MGRPPGRHRWSPPVPPGSGRTAIRGAPGQVGDAHPRWRFRLTPGRRAGLVIGVTLAASSGVVGLSSLGSVDPSGSRVAPGSVASPFPDSSVIPSDPAATPTASTGPVPPTPVRAPTSARTVSGQQTDDRYATCGQVIAAGLGPYKRDRDPEYRWYVDDDRDGWACERSGRSSVRYRNCAEVRAAGAAPLHRGEPGYGRHLDHDGDGIACD